MRATDAKQFPNIDATTDPFVLGGGLYSLIATGSWNTTGSATLQMLACDATTWIPAAGPITADGVTTAYLPPGQYRFAIDTATAVYLSICRVPFD
jgi:hypothetical protein